MGPIGAIGAVDPGSSSASSASLCARASNRKIRNQLVMEPGMGRVTLRWVPLPSFMDPEFRKVLSKLLIWYCWNVME